ncbi:EXO5 [Candida margitis]|uniref:EXO5 n=1 Tax=Candida margitis TaxID=1775924 RepID=UPI0022265177|nr:EXO5 [Candida margitis]KAI5967676.1 EXO5 [Candida margitis]
MSAAMLKVEVEGACDSLGNLALEDTFGSSLTGGERGKKKKAKAISQGDDTRVLHKPGYDDDLFKIEKQRPKFTQAQIRDFEAHLNEKEKEAYAQAIIRQVQQSSETAAKNAEKKATKTRKTKSVTKSKKGGAKATSPSPLQTEDELLFANNESLSNIYDNWNLSHSANLPIVSPLPGDNIPFTFFSKHNADPTIIQSPRLSVTRILVNNWCQAREYYKIYSGSLRSPPSEAMEQGSRYHAALEEETHPSIDLSDLLTFVSQKADALKKALSGKTGKLKRRQKVPADALSKGQNGKEVVELLDEMKSVSQEDLLANEWSHKVISRLFALLTNAKAREIPIHGYINLNQAKFIEPRDGASALDNSVLVSAIVDLFQFKNHKDPTDLTFFTEMQNMMEFEFDKDRAGSKLMIDLTRFMPEAAKVLAEYNRNDNLSLVISDVKTRSDNSVPYQQSVVAGAKVQTFLYRRFFDTLSKDAPFTYRGFIENAMKRNLDIDKPLSPFIVLQMLRLNHNLFYNDFVKLSNGEPLGFDPFDEDLKLNKLSQSLAGLKIEGSGLDSIPLGSASTKHDAFRFDLLFQNVNDFSFTTPSNQSYLNELDQLEPQQSKQQFPYSHYMKPLLKTWQTPPTLRYLAARSAQLLHLFNNFTDNLTTVEYHNALKHEVFEIRQYQYQEQDLQAEVDEASKFWLGKLVPQFADSKSKCNYCEFKLKCIVGRGEADDDMYKRKMVGPKVRQFIGQSV